MPNINAHKCLNESPYEVNIVDVANTPPKIYNECMNERTNEPMKERVKEGKKERRKEERKKRRKKEGKKEKRRKQVAQGQYVVSDTRCPALSDCELE